MADIKVLDCSSGIVKETDSPMDIIWQTLVGNI
jgi:hypothetical protein